MTKFLFLALTLLLAVPSFALDGMNVRYEGGTAANVSPRSVGRLDTTSNTALVFQSASRKIEIPYASIQSYQYSCEIAHRLGFLPTIAVGLLKVRQRKHFLRITYRERDGEAAQVAVFEVPKQSPRILQPLLAARAAGSSKTCAPCSYLE